MPAPAWRLEQAGRERTWALVSARAEGISIRTLAQAIGLSPSRVHQLVADADLDALDAALGELQAAGWPAPEDPDSDEDTDLAGRDHLADRLSDEVDWLRQCADWLRQLDGACDENWCRILSVTAQGDLMLAAISGRRGIPGCRG